MTPPGPVSPDSGDELANAAWSEMQRHSSERACDDGCDSELDCAAAVIAAVRPLIEAEVRAQYGTPTVGDLVAQQGIRPYDGQPIQWDPPLTDDERAAFTDAVEARGMSEEEIRADERNRIADAIEAAQWVEHRKNPDKHPAYYDGMDHAACIALGDTP